MSKMMKCKTCGADIAKSAKVCPKCGAKNKNNTLLVISIVLIVIAIIGASASGSKSSPSASSSSNISKNSSQVESQEVKDTSFGLGDKADLDGVTVSLINVSENNGSTYMKPENGNVFIVCEFEIENTSDEDIAISSILSFDAYIDDYAAGMNLGATLSTEKSQLDGSVAAGKKMNGVVGYEANPSWKELEIRFSPDFWKGKQIIFKYNK